jgi:cytoskeletal protein CcmA (bactofilin family)
MSDQQSSIGSGAKFSGKISGAKALEINGTVEADIDIGKITIGQEAHFTGGIKADLAVISGVYEGTMQAESIWLTDTSRVSGEIRYQSLQMDRGAALNCRVVYNWDENDNKTKKNKSKNSEKITEEATEESESNE